VRREINGNYLFSYGKAVRCSCRRGPLCGAGIQECRHSYKVGFAVGLLACEREHHISTERTWETKDPFNIPMRLAQGAEKVRGMSRTLPNHVLVLLLKFSLRIGDYAV
jgi:hypothetical protein